MSETLTFKRAGRVLSESDLSALERKFGVRLPASYRAFLLRTNGGVPSRPVFRFPENGKVSSSALHYFLFVDENSHVGFESSFKSFKVLSKRLPKRLVPIARDPGGSLVCLSIEGDDVGSVFFWDHEDGRVHFVTPTFDEFLESLEHEVPTR